MMVINLMCGDCLGESVKNGTVYHEEFSVPISEILDDSVYEVTCEKGHITKCFLNNQKFELLFDLGLNDFIDGSYRGAVTSFASSLERFYEFFIKTNLVESPSLEAVWKHVKNQSERQLGGYLFLYLSVTGEAPLILSDNFISFRNNVMHKGYIPKREEALDFGEAVRKIVNHSIKVLKRTCGDRVVSALDQFEKKHSSQEDIKFTTNILTVLDVTRGPEFDSDDIRRGSLMEIVPHALRNRKPQRLRIFKTEAERAVAENELKRDD